MRTRRPGRTDCCAFAAALLLAFVALARAAPRQLYVRLPAGMSAATSQRLLSALQAQRADLASIELTERSAQDALGIVSIVESAGATGREPAVQDRRAQEPGEKPAPVEPTAAAAAPLAAPPAPDASQAAPGAPAAASAARRPIVEDRLPPSGAETWRSGSPGPTRAPCTRSSCAGSTGCAST